MKVVRAQIKRPIIHLKSWSGKRAVCGVRTHMRAEPKPGRRVRLTTTSPVTCLCCLRTAVALVRREES